MERGHHEGRRWDVPDLLHPSHCRQDQPRDQKAPQVVENPGQLLTEVDTYLRTVAKAATAQVATNLWQPGPVQAAPLKRLQPGAKKGKTHRGGAQGKGHYKGSRGRGRHGGGSSGRGGSGCGGRGPTIINSGIHYHNWYWKTPFLKINFFPP